MTREEELSAELARKDADLAKAKRMMVALNNKVKIKIAVQDAKMKEEGDRLREEIENLKTQLASSSVPSSIQDTESSSNWEAERLELQEQIREKDALITEKDDFIAMAKEKFREQGEKARSLIKERDEQIALKEQEIVELTEQVSSLNDVAAADSESLKARLTELEEKLRAADAANQQHDEADASKNHDFEDLRQQLENELANARTTIVELNSELSIKLGQLKELHEKTSDLSNQLQMCEERAAESEVQVQCHSNILLIQFTRI